MIIRAKIKKLHMKKFFGVLLILLALVFNSCRLLNPSQMLRTKKDFKFDKFSENQVASDYIIAANDILTFSVLTNQGQKLIDPLEQSNFLQNLERVTYTIESSGEAKLPQLGWIKLQGLTIKQAEELLEQKYSAYYNEPYVKINITNKRVIVFPGGEGGTAKVVYLKNPNTTVFEALAEAGGISDGKAHRVKLIRGNLKEPQVFLIDLSTIEGVKNADLAVQANDIIYVEPRNKIPERIVKELSPYLTLLTAVLLVISITK